jgi:hypothetical protein
MDSGAVDFLAVRRRRDDCPLSQCPVNFLALPSLLLLCLRAPRALMPDATESGDCLHWVAASGARLDADAVETEAVGDWVKIHISS